MNLAVVVCGRIGSGKSTAVDFLAAEFGLKTVSFGSYIRHIAALRGTGSTRDQLQDLGDCLFKSKGSLGLLESALEHFRINRYDSVVFDGVRHLEILTDIRRAAEETFAIYLEVNQKERFRRYRARQISSGSLEEFLIVDGHPVETGIGKIVEYCDVVVDAACCVKEVQAMLRAKLSGHR